MLNNEQIEAWERLSSNATSGPWECVEDEEFDGAWRVRFSDGEDASLLKRPDAAFIVASREAMPELIKELRKAREEIALLERECEGIRWAQA